MKPLTEAEQTQVRDALVHADSILSLLYFRGGERLLGTYYDDVHQAFLAVVRAENLMGIRR